MVSPSDASTISERFGRGAAPQHFHDRKSRTPLSIGALGLAGFATPLFVPTLARHKGPDEWLLLFVALVLYFLAWRCWRFARSPYLTLRGHDLVLQRFLEPLRLPLEDITAAGVEFTMMRPKRNHPPIPVHTFHLALRNGRFAKRVLPFGSDARMLEAFKERTHIQLDDIRGADGVKDWRERQRVSWSAQPQMRADQPGRLGER